MVTKLKNKQCIQTMKDQLSNESVDHRFQLMANYTPVLIWMSDKNLSCTFVNKSWVNFTGRSLAEELGDGWVESIHPDDLLRVNDFVSRAFKERKPCEIEYRLRHADGAYRWILDKAVPYYDKNNHYQGFIGSCIDITSKKQLESYRKAEIRRLKLLNSSLMKVNTELEGFSSMVAHDLKTPLRHLFMYAELLKNDLNLDVISKKSLHALEMIESVATSARAFIDNLWIVATLGASSLAFEEVCLGNLVRQSLEYLALELDQVEIDLIIEPLPKVSCCPSLIVQVFQNLLQNAIKFRQKDHKLRITIEAEEQQEFWKIYIRDNGIGIESRYFHHIFETYKQLSPTNSSEEGAGLGLFICKKVIKYHEGEIGVSSDGCQKGSTFYFTLPKKRVGEI